MKKVFLSAVVASAIAAAGIATTQDKPMNSQEPREVKQSSQTAPAKTMHGTVTSVDNTGKSFVVKDESGKEVTVYWDSSTKVNGDLKVGSTVSFQASEQSGKWMATSIDASSSKKPY